MGGPGKKCSVEKGESSLSHGCSSAHVHSREFHVTKTTRNIEGAEETVPFNSKTTKFEIERWKKEEIKRKTKLDEIAEEHRKQERELEEKERHGKEEILGRATAVPSRAELSAMAPIAPVAVASRGVGLSVKTKRGKTRNLGLYKKKNANEKLIIDIPEEVNRIVGVNSQYAITESGCLTRKNAPLQMTKWAKIDENKKLGLLRDFKSSFSYGESQRCENTIFAQMNIQYRNYRHRLYKNYFLKGVVPPNVEKDDWEYLIDYFGSDEYQAMSRRNTENRAKAKDDAKHIAGTRSFARICREREEKKMDVVKQIELYKITHCRFDDESEEGCWINEAAKENYCRMLEIRNQKINEGEVEVDEEQICGEVLGFKSGYIRGRGAGPKPSRSLPHRNYGKELEEANKHAKLAHERAEKAEQQLTVFFEQLEKQQSVIQDLKEGLAATQKAMAESHKSTAEMMPIFGQFRPTNQFSAMSQWFPTPLNYAHHSMQGFMHGYSSQNIRNSNTESDELSGEPGLRELIHEVSRYPISAPFQQ